MSKASRSLWIIHRFQFVVMSGGEKVPNAWDDDWVEKADVGYLLCGVLRVLLIEMLQRPQPLMPNQRLRTRNYQRPKSEPGRPNSTDRYGQMRRWPSLSLKEKIYLDTQRFYDRLVLCPDTRYCASEVRLQTYHESLESETCQHIHNV